MSDIVERLAGPFMAERAALKAMEDAAAEIERLRAVMKTAIRQFEDGNLLSCHRTLCDEVHGRQK